MPRVYEPWTYLELFILQNATRKYIRRLNIRPQAKLVATALCTELQYVMWMQSLTSPRNAWYCVVSQAYLAHQLGCSTRTIRRRLNILRSLQLVTTRRRYIRAGKFEMTSVFIPGKALRVLMTQQKSQPTRRPRNSTRKPHRRRSRRP